MVDLRRRQDVIEHEVRLMKSQLDECLESHPKGVIDKEEVQRSVKEVLEQERRQMNVVIRNLPGIEDDSTPGKIMKAVGDLFRRKLEVNSTEIEKAEKIQTAKGNLVKVKLKNRQAKRTVLANARKLKDDDTYQDVYLKPDLTFEQRKRDASLRGELKLRKESGEKNLIIVRGKIVSKTNHPPSLTLENN